ncbi:hypothetical protein F2P79_013478 [Pimephales promelas]|nr:hypothetical protein F2P79_013478 [Pimephales promelas]
MGSLPSVPTLRLRVSERRQGPARERRSGQARQLAFPAGYWLLSSEEGEKSILRRDAARGRPTLPPAMEPWEPVCSAFSLSRPNLSQLASAKERANSLDALHATPMVLLLSMYKVLYIRWVGIREHFEFVFTFSTMVGFFLMVATIRVAWKRTLL